MNTKRISKKHIKQALVKVTKQVFLSNASELLKTPSRKIRWRQLANDKDFVNKVNDSYIIHMTTDEFDSTFTDCTVNDIELALLEFQEEI